ncbi:MAG TPA: hypothetical protein DCY89_05495 [Gammaproteobacteria bacterium]|nr:hypothetical protein [Gammaproteobacteria bacterium]
MTPELLTRIAIDPALSLLPPRMDSRAARVLMLAIAGQESAMRHRRQIRGPARGFWQFEQGGGVAGVLRHAQSKPHIRSVLRALHYPATSTAADCYIAIEHNDVLAAAFARLLLWTDPAPLPTDAAGGWSLYLRTWRPGKPHPDTWAGHFARATEAVG